MADTHKSLSELEKMREQQSALNKLIQDEINGKKGVVSQQEQSRLLSEQIANNQKLLAEATKSYLAGEKDALKLVEQLRNEQKSLIDKEKEFNKTIREGNKARQTAVDLTRQLGGAVKGLWTYLQSQDKIIRSTVLNLGMSGTKAEMMRSSFENSAIFAARLGANLEDLQKIQEGYADETGRARAMTSEMLSDITMIGKGTGLGIEQATKLGAQFELMGFDAKSTMNYVQGVVDSSERMGVNTTKVLKNINDNFKKLNTYNFQQGVKGFAEMAQYAEKFKIDISDALNAADTARTLDGAINMVAKLQVMGGEFAKLDMFQTLYFARNDPKKLQEKIAGLTKNLVTLRKTSDGTFEKFISPADRDRLAFAGKALGITTEKMTEMAERAFDISKMAQQLQGLGLTDREKELVQGAAVFNAKSGRFQVELAGRMEDISNLTKDQAKAFAKEQVSLEERAKNAQTFDETFKATIQELKASLLPVLNGINKYLLPAVKWLADLATKGWGGLAATAAILAGAAVAWKTVTFGLGRVADKFLESGKLGGAFKSIGFGKSSSIAKEGGGMGKSASKWFTKAGNIKKGAGGLAAGQGLKSLGTGAGIGAAAIGLGAGVGLAAEGISKLADSMSKLTKDQAENLKSIAMTLAITFPAAAVGIGIVAAVAAPAAPVLLALGAALLMIGGAVGIAAAGIGYMGTGLGDMFKNIKGAGDDFIKVASGIGMMSAAFGVSTMSLPAAIGLSFAIGRIAKHADAIKNVGDGFANIKSVMSGSKDDFIAVQNAVESISKANIKGGGMFAELANLLKSPLKVEFENGGKVQLSNDITLNMNGEVFMHKVYDTVVAIEKQQSAYQGKSGKK